MESKHDQHRSFFILINFEKYIDVLSFMCYDMHEVHIDSLWGRVQIPTDGIVHEPICHIGRFGEIPKPTV